MEMPTLPLVSLIAVLVFLPGALPELVAPHGSLGVHAPPGTIFSAAAYQLARRSRKSSAAPVELGSDNTLHSSGLELMREIIRYKRNSSSDQEEAPVGEATPLNPPENMDLSPNEKAALQLFKPEPIARARRRSRKRDRTTTTTPMPDYVDDETEEATLSPEEKEQFESFFESPDIDLSKNAAPEDKKSVEEHRDESLDPKHKSTLHPMNSSSTSKASISSLKPFPESTTQSTPTMTATEKPSSQPGTGVNAGEEKKREMNHGDTQMRNNQTGNSLALRSVEYEQGNNNGESQKPKDPPGSASQMAPEKTHGETAGKLKEPKTSSEHKKDEVPSQTAKGTPTPAVPKQVKTQHEETQVGRKDSNVSLSQQDTKLEKHTDDANAATSSGDGEHKEDGETTTAATPLPASGYSTSADQKMTKPGVPVDPVPTAAPKSLEVQDRMAYSHAQQSNQYVPTPEIKETLLVQKASESKPEGLPRGAALVSPPYLKFSDVENGQRSQSVFYPGSQDYQSHQDLGTYRQSYQGSQGLQSLQNSQGNDDHYTFRGPQSYQGLQGGQSFQSSHVNQDLNTFRGPQSYQGSQRPQNYQSSQVIQSVLQRPYSIHSSQTSQGLQNVQSFHGVGDGAPRAAAVKLQRTQETQATPQVFSRWFGDVMQWSDAQELLYRVKTGQELPKQDYRGVRITYKVNGYSEPPAPQPTPAPLPPYSPPLSQLVAPGPANTPAGQIPPGYPGPLYHQQFASSHPQTLPGLSAAKPAIIVVPSQYSQPSLPEYLAPSHSLPYQSPAVPVSNGPAVQTGAQGEGPALPGVYTHSYWPNQAQPSIPPYLIRVYTKQEPQGPP